MAGIPSHLITFWLSAPLFGFAVSRVVLLFGGQFCTALPFSASWPLVYSACLFASFPVFSFLFLLFHVFSAFWPSCVQCMSFRPLSVGFPGGGCAAPSWFVRGFGGCCDLLCHVGCLVVCSDPFSVGVGVGSRVFWRLAGVVFWPRLFWLCVIGTRILLRFARENEKNKL